MSNEILNDMCNYNPEIFKIPEEYICRNYDDGNRGISDFRTTFMRDRDRILYCTAFRRLVGKTQIYTIGSDDHKYESCLKRIMRTRSSFLTVQ